MFINFIIVGIFILGGIAFTLVTLFINRLLSPNKPNIEKETTYECGVDTTGPTWIQFKISYFLYALIFLVFDVEIVFLFPWAVMFKSLGLLAFVEMIIFIGMLVLGLLYAWKKGALEWK